MWQRCEYAADGMEINFSVRPYSRTPGHRGEGEREKKRCFDFLQENGNISNQWIHFVAKTLKTTMYSFQNKSSIIIMTG